MRTFLRVLPLIALVAMMSMAILPAAGQDSTKVEAADCSYGGNIKSIEAIDATTVQFTFCTPDPAFPAKAAFSAFAIHSADQLIATNGGGDELLSNPIGTGAYILKSWDRGNEIVLEANPNYWGGAPIEPTVILKWNSEAAARLVELQAGSIDGIDNPGPADFAVIEANPDLALKPRLSQNVFYLGINNTVAPFDNQLVRQAVSYGIDKARIIDNFYPPGSTVANQFMPESIFGYTADSIVIGYDAEKAKQLLAESGVELPIKTTLSYRDVVRGYLPQPGVVAQELQAQLAAIGIEVEIQVMESGAFLDASSAGELSLHLLGWGADYPDATNFLDFHFGSGASDQFGAKDPVLTAMLTEAAQLLTRRLVWRSTLKPTTKSPTSSRWFRSPMAVAPPLGRPASLVRTPVPSARNNSAPWKTRLTTTSSTCRTLNRSACIAMTKPTARPSVLANKSTNPCSVTSWAVVTSSPLWRPNGLPTKT